MINNVLTVFIKLLLASLRSLSFLFIFLSFVSILFFSIWIFNNSNNNKPAILPLCMTVSVALTAFSTSCLHFCSYYTTLSRVLSTCGREIDKLSRKIKIKLSDRICIMLYEYQDYYYYYHCDGCCCYYIYVTVMFTYPIHYLLLAVLCLCTSTFSFLPVYFICAAIVFISFSFSLSLYILKIKNPYCLLSV